MFAMQSHPINKWLLPSLIIQELFPLLIGPWILNPTLCKHAIIRCCGVCNIHTVEVPNKTLQPNLCSKLEVS